MTRDYLIVFGDSVYYVDSVSEEDGKNLEACNNKPIDSDHWLRTWLENKEKLMIEYPVRFLNLNAVTLIVTGAVS